MIKELYNKSMTNNLESQLALESKLQIEAAQRLCRRLALQHFIEKKTKL
jgi:2-(1,2-epoxy-1,2-dihydrophenyl)acetyl-CoA isomerase